MITNGQIKNLAKVFQIDEYSVFREYLQLVFLSYLYQERKANKLLFKWGTALRLFFGSPRFSEDLDFSTNYNDSEIIELLNNVVVKIKKELPNFRIISLHKGTEGIRFRILFNQKEFKYPFSIRLDFHQEKEVTGAAVSTLLTQFPLMIFPQVYHLSGESILFEKFDALKNRNKGRDIFDIWFLLSRGIRITDVKKSDIKNIDEFSQKLLEKDLGQFLPHGQKQIIAVLKQEIIKLLQK